MNKKIKIALLVVGIFLMFSYIYGVFALGYLEPYPKYCGWFPKFVPIQIIKFLNDAWILPQPIICAV